MHSRIEASPEVLHNQPLLNVLGIRYVLAVPGESLSKQLTRVAKIPLPEMGPFHLFENPSVWSDAEWVDERSRALSLKRSPACAHHRLLCADFLPAEQLRAAGQAVAVRRRPGGIDLSFQHPSAPGLLRVNEYFRPEWTAQAIMQDGQRSPLSPVPVFESLVGVPVPPGATAIRLSYRPWRRIALELLSWLTAFCVVAVLCLRLLRPSAPHTTAGQSTYAQS